MLAPIILLFLISSINVVVGENTTVPLDDEYPVYSDPRCLTQCFFETNILQKSSMKQFPQNCTTVCAPYGLHIGYETDMSEKQMISTLKNMKHLIGTLVIMRTKFTSAKFLAPLETIDCYNVRSFSINTNDVMAEVGMTSLTNVSCAITFSGNGLYKLNVPKLIPVASSYVNYTRMEVEFYGNTPDFCVTVEEMSNFMTYDDTVLDRFGRTTGKYCEISNSSVFPIKTCDIGKVFLQNLDSGCVNLRGDLLIGKGDEGYVQKLESVDTIFGNLHITGTNLTNTSFLGKLRRVMSITKDKPTILGDYNPLLTNVSFPSLKRILSTVLNPIQFNNNTDVLAKNPVFCNSILSSINNDTTWIIKFDGNVCSDIQKAYDATVKDKSGRGALSTGNLLIVIIIGLFAWS